MNQGFEFQYFSGVILHLHRTHTHARAGSHRTMTLLTCWYSGSRGKVAGIAPAASSPSPSPTSSVGSEVGRDVDREWGSGAAVNSRRNSFDAVNSFESTVLPKLLDVPPNDVLPVFLRRMSSSMRQLIGEMSLLSDITYQIAYTCEGGSKCGAGRCRRDRDGTRLDRGKPIKAT